MIKYSFRKYPGVGSDTHLMTISLIVGVSYIEIDLKVSGQQFAAKAPST